MTASHFHLGPNDRNSWRADASHADLTRPERPVRRVSFEAAPKRVTIDLGRAAMVVVDMQNAFCHPDGWLGHIGVDVTPCRAPIPALVDAVPVLRAAGVPIVWLNWGARADLANLNPTLFHVYKPMAGPGVAGLGEPVPTRGAKTLDKGSFDAALVEELTPAAGDIHVDKHRMSGFWDTPLDSILRNLKVDTLLFGGVNADQCVLHTLADANFLGYDVIMLEDCSATSSPAFCWDATLYNIRQIFGFTAHARALTAALSAA